MKRRRCSLEAREEYYRGLKSAENYGIRKGMEQGIKQGMERGQKEADHILVSNVEHAMESFHVGLAEACAGLGTTVEAYRAAKKRMESE